MARRRALLDELPHLGLLLLQLVASQRHAEHLLCVEERRHGVQDVGVDGGPGFGAVLFRKAILKGGVLGVSLSISRRVTFLTFPAMRIRMLGTDKTAISSLKGC